MNKKIKGTRMNDFFLRTLEYSVANTMVFTCARAFIEINRM